mmetsp:Transcript_61137/g.111975  ORF Transcript_61137/g.111975 Transcript_61137/m.111975 type:complete len:165 (-) Transcript_61137:103-597(-)
MVTEGEAYDKILYVSKNVLQDVTNSVKDKKASKNISPKLIEDLFMPEEEADSALLLPVDVSLDEFGEVYEGHDEVMARLGAEGTAKAVVKAAELFDKSKKNFAEDERPIPMTVGEWKTFAQQEEGEDEEEDEEEDADEEEEEEDGEEDEAEEEAEPSSKKRKVS